MARGKQTCKILKEIRRQIAEANDIEFVTSECRYKGDCLGTCPKCEAEVRYLEQQLRARQLMGKAVVLAGISAGMIVFSGCGNSSSQADSYRLQGEPMESLQGAMILDCEEEQESEIEAVDSVFDSSGVKEGEAISVDEATISSINQEQESTATKTVKCPTSFTNVEASASTEKTEELIYAVVGEVAETQPEFPGGINAMFQFFVENLKYPPTCDDVQGKVIVRFLVDKTGKIRNTEIARSNLPEEFNKEVLRVVRLLPKFKPGERDGVPVDVWQAVPISFRLMDYQKLIDNQETE
ncbi:MAG: energy transducer TonB [Paenibacillus sp.]|nr:energy transducer TonB [Paenibacillus sp.]